MKPLNILKLLSSLEYAYIQMSGSVSEFIGLREELIEWLGEDYENFEILGVQSSSPAYGKANFLIRRRRPKVVGPKVRINTRYLQEIVLPVLEALVEQGGGGSLSFKASLREALDICIELREKYRSEGWDFFPSAEKFSQGIVKITLVPVRY